MKIEAAGGDSGPLHRLRPLRTRLPRGRRRGHPGEAVAHGWRCEQSRREGREKVHCSLHDGKTPDKEITDENFIKGILADWYDDAGAFSGGGWAAAEVKLVKGQTLYVPSPTSFMAGTYSFNVRATVFIHNADPTNAINITGIDFYNSGGKLVEKYVTQPLKLNALAVSDGSFYVHRW